MSPQRGGRIKVRTVLNSMLWLCPTIAVPSLFLAAYFADTVPTWLLVVFAAIAASPVATAVLTFVCFALTDPDRLQSEDHQIGTRVLDTIIREKGNLSEDGRSVKLTQNPQSAKLVDKSEEDQ